MGRVFQDDLPVVSISRLRAEGKITAETTRARISLAGVEFEVSLLLQEFPNGGSWSLFCCPSCGGKARVLRVHDGAVVCRRCCLRRGVWFRCWGLGRGDCAEARIVELRTQLESPVPLRLKPHLWGKLERRGRLEAALARAEFIVAEHQLKGGK
jgi:hypothetical protein